MINEEIAQEIMDFINKKVEELGHEDYCEVLEDVSEQTGSSASVKREELGED